MSTTDSTTFQHGKSRAHGTTASRGHARHHRQPHTGRSFIFSFFPPSSFGAFWVNHNNKQQFVSVPRRRRRKGGEFDRPLPSGLVDFFFFNAAEVLLCVLLCNSYSMIYSCMFESYHTWCKPRSAKNVSVLESSTRHIYINMIYRERVISRPFFASWAFGLGLSRRLFPQNVECFPTLRSTWSAWRTTGWYPWLKK